MLSEMKLNHLTRVKFISDAFETMCQGETFFQKITVAIFGSVQRLESLQNSDIDLMIVFNDERTKSIYHLSGVDKLLFFEMKKLDDTLAGLEYHENWKFSLLAEELEDIFTSNGRHKDFLLSVHFLTESIPVWNKKMYLALKRLLLRMSLIDEPQGTRIFRRVSTFNKHFESLLEKNEKPFVQVKVMKTLYSRKLMALSIFLLDFTQLSEDTVIQFLNADPMSRLFGKREASVDSGYFRPYLDVFYGVSKGIFSNVEPFSDEVYKSKKKKADDFIISTAEYYDLKAKLSRYSFFDSL